MLNEVKTLMKEGDYEELLDWAFDNDKRCSTKETLAAVADAYKYLLENGYGIAANNLGSMYYDGRYFNEDVEAAVSYFEMACDMGITPAWYNLGRCYYYGPQKDYAKAYAVFAEGAFLFMDVRCLYMLAEMYEFGYHVKQSNDKARHLYCRANDLLDIDNPYDYDCIADLNYRFARFILECDHNINQALKKLYTAMAYLREKTDDEADLSLIDNVKVLIGKAEEETANITGYYA